MDPTSSQDVTRCCCIKHLVQLLQPHAPLTTNPSILLLNSLPPSPSQLASVLHFLIPSCFSVGPPFLLMSVVSTHGAAPSQLDVAEPSQASNQSKEQSIACGLMFIKATHIHLHCRAKTLQWLTYTEAAAVAWL